MRALMMVIILGMLAGWLSAIYDMENTKRLQFANKVGTAINFVQLREAAMRYGFLYKDEPDGDIPENALRELLPDDWREYRGISWNARIDGGYIYVWGAVDPEVIEQARKMVGFSPSVGECQDGRLRPADIPLPGFIPNGSLVSATGSARYKPDNENY